VQESDERPETVFARRMREVRDDSAVSQAALAAVMAAAGGPRLDSTAITRMERGTRAIRLCEAVAVARALNVPLGDMLRPAPPLTERVAQAGKAAHEARLREAEATAERGWAEDRHHQLRDLLEHHRMLERVGISPDELVTLDELGLEPGKSYSMAELGDAMQAFARREAEDESEASDGDSAPR